MYLRFLADSKINGIKLQTKGRPGQKKQVEVREEERKKSEDVKLNLLAATADLSCATAVSLKYGRTNGEIDEGLKQYNKAIAAFRDYEREKLAEQV